jgi:hypothetical protein
MDYRIDIYDGDEKNRFVLGNKGKKTLFVIGLNPSTADKNKPDRTISKVMGIAEGHKCDSFVMLNLYPQRATDPNRLHEKFDETLFKQNLQEIEKILKNVEKPLVFVAWGDKIGIRKYLYRCAKDIITCIGNNAIWLKTGKLTAKGNPRHPLYAQWAWGLSEFEVNNYVETFKN